MLQALRLVARLRLWLKTSPAIEPGAKFAFCARQQPMVKNTGQNHNRFTRAKQKATAIHPSTESEESIKPPSLSQAMSWSILRCLYPFLTA